MDVCEGLATLPSYVSQVLKIIKNWVNRIYGSSVTVVESSAKCL